MSGKFSTIIVYVSKLEEFNCSFKLPHFSQKANDLTGEYSTIMITILKTDKVESGDWLSMYYRDFRRRIIKLLAKTFQSFTTGLALSLLDNKSVMVKNEREYNFKLSVEEKLQSS